MVLGAESAVVILDDTSGVWPLHQPNLLQARADLPSATRSMLC